MQTIKKVSTITSLLSLLIILLSGLASAGTTGKISGKVIDAATGEPIIGANVLIIGTTLGAAADFDGNYFIINIPPGRYEVKASSIGYNSVTNQNIQVSVDQTTKLNFSLEEEAVEIEDVVVVATKPIVQKDLTSTQSNVSGEDIQMLPLEDVGSVVNLQAGVINGHFRGGRIGEVQYLIDGVSSNDVFSGEPSMEPQINSVQEVQILTGTFNAEYGDALSGVVNQITKLPDENYEFSFSGYAGDYVSNRTDIFKDIGSVSPTGVYNLMGTFSGPILGTSNSVSFFLSGRYLRDDGYIFGQRIYNPQDYSLYVEGNPVIENATGDSAFVPMNFDYNLQLQAKLAFKVGTGKGIILNGLYSSREYRDYDHNYRLNPDGDYKRFNDSYLLSASYTHVFSNSTFLDVLGSGYFSDYKQYVYENLLDPRYRPLKWQQGTGPNTFLTGGTQNWHFYHKVKSYTGKLDLTSQITNIHQIKTGVEFKYHDIYYKDIQILFDINDKPYLPEPGSFSYNVYNANPYQGAAYIQDKIELDYLIVNVGLRFDYFQPDGKYLLDPNNIGVLDLFPDPPYPDSLLGVSSEKTQFSPRLGISYPITDKGAIHISWGHFFQIPPFEYIYRNPNFRVPFTGDFPENVGNTIGNTDLKPQMTVMYEIGLQQELFTDFGITLTAYLKDIRNLLGSEVYLRTNTKKFSKVVNVDYGSVKGITLSLEKRLSNGFGFTMDYTYQDAKGNASDPNDAFDKAQSNPPVEVSKQLAPLDWDRTHALNFTLTIGVPGDYIISSVGRWGTGLPYTPAIQNQRTGLENSDSKPNIFNVDLYITKFLKILNQNLSLFIKVYNVFDNANEIEVFSDTGRAGYSLEVTRGGTQPSKGVNTIEEYYTRPDYYSSPRQIILGASLEL